MCEFNQRFYMIHVYVSKKERKKINMKTYYCILVIRTVCICTCRQDKTLTEWCPNQRLLKKAIYNILFTKVLRATTNISMKKNQAQKSKFVQNVLRHRQTYII